jgi:hypothetical protein
MLVFTSMTGFWAVILAEARIQEGRVWILLDAGHSTKLMAPA